MLQNALNVVSVIRVILLLRSIFLTRLLLINTLQKQIRHLNVFLLIYIDVVLCHIQVLDILDLKILFDSDYTYKPSRNQGLIQHFTKYATYAVNFSAINLLDVLILVLMMAYFYPALMSNQVLSSRYRSAHAAVLRSIQWNSNLHDFFNAQRNP